MIRLSYLEWRAAGDDFGRLGAGRFRRRAPGKKGGLLLAGMVARTRICLRRLAGGRRSGIVGFSRFLANPRVTVEALLDGWGAELSQGCAGRHILAIQDTSEINFTTTKERSRGLGEIGKGSGRGVLLHAMLGLDAETGGILGLATGRAWPRAGPGHGLGLATGWVWPRAGCGPAMAGLRFLIGTGRCPRRSRSGG